MDKRLRLTAALGIAMAAGVSWAHAQSAPEHAGSENNVMVEHADLVLPGSNPKTALGYATIWNGSKVQKNLVAIESDVFASASLQRTAVDENGVEAAAALDGARIPGHAELLMQAGGIHITLTNPRRSVKPGDQTRLTLVFEDQSSVTTLATVRPAGWRLKHHHGEPDRVD